MSRLLRAIIISAYSALIFYFIKSLYSKEIKIEIQYIIRTPGTLRKLERDIKKNTGSYIQTNFTKPDRLYTDFKYILKWTEAFSHYNSRYSKLFKTGQQAFMDNNCTYRNCFVSNDKSLLGDLRYYDAILFDVENNWDRHPPVRAAHQKYIFTASESSGYYPICSSEFDGYYNLTWTYKLNSDIRWSYFTILDKEDNVVGPKVNVSWILPMNPTPDHVKKKLRLKKKAVAWFVSNCQSKKRRIVADNLAKSLNKFRLKVDIYGWCGNKTCPKNRLEDCLDLLQKSYYFYLAFENSMAEDYVTEKILYPTQHYAVPIVYGGADYGRFLPPASYIDAGKLNSDEVATLIAAAIKDRNVYEEYFRWHNYYVYKEQPPIADICQLCKSLHTEETKVVKNLRKWWNPQYKEICRHGSHFTDLNFY
ncbi:unnamed protein product [Pieris macdunnoughi]|uniref:Fucosyltransferase n=1 Tax=Pieris macdunnoughi TaxID=345717 RepID=A0A821M2Q1_9NEOP|nr:unnamed protein product [Pieris macdunnoughi]